MKIYNLFFGIWFAILIPIACAHGKTMNVEDGFVSPKLTIASVQVGRDGAITASEAGRSFELWLRSSRGEAFGPLVFWLDNKSQVPLFVDSIGSINCVLRDVGAVPPERLGEILYQITGLVSRQYLAEGARTGIILSDSNRKTLLWLLRNRLSADALKSLEAKTRALDVSVKEQSWTMRWMEVDRVGAIESVEVEGSVKGLSIRRIVREVVLPPGSIPVDVLKTENFVS